MASCLAELPERMPEWTLILQLPLTEFNPKGLSVFYADLRFKGGLIAHMDIQQAAPR
jgi:hypothetical protein